MYTEVEQQKTGDVEGIAAAAADEQQNGTRTRS